MVDAVFPFLGRAPASWNPSLTSTNPLSRCSVRNSRTLSGATLAHKRGPDEILRQLEAKNSAVVLVGNFKESKSVIKLHDVGDLTLLEFFQGLCDVFVHLLFEISGNEPHVASPFSGAHFGVFLRNFRKIVALLHSSQGFLNFLPLGCNLVGKAAVDQTP